MGGDAASLMVGGHLVKNLSFIWTNSAPETSRWVPVLVQRETTVAGLARACGLWVPYINTDLDPSRGVSAAELASVPVSLPKAARCWEAGWASPTEGPWSA